MWWKVSKRDLLFVLGELSLTDNGQDEVLFKWEPCDLSCQCGWGQKTLTSGVDLPTNWQMEAVGFLKPQSHGLLSQGIFTRTAPKTHLRLNGNAYLPWGEDSIFFFFKENYLRQRTTQTNPSCNYSERRHVTFLWHYLQFWTTFFGVLHKIMCIIGI